MKPAPFEYARPSDLAEACAMLAAADDARIIAGGQSLVPLMAMRLARPQRLIVIARIPVLAFVHQVPERLPIGATTRQFMVERHPCRGHAGPLYPHAHSFIGRVAI